MKREISRLEGTKSGIYKITNNINGKYYIGSTKHLSSRYRTHLSTLKNNISSCLILQNAVNKYGIENFTFSVLEVCTNYKEREIEILNNKFPSYNIVKETKIRRELSEETRKKMSESQKLSYLNGRKRGANKGATRIVNVKYSVIVFDTISKESLLFDSVITASEHFNTSIKTLYTANKRQTKFKKRYIINFKRP